MKKMVLSFSLLVFLLLSPLAMGSSLGQIQTSHPVKDVRPTPVPDRLLPSQEVPASLEIPPLPDLIITNIELEPAQPYLGQEVTIRVTIANPSQWDLTPGNNFWSDLYVDPAVVPIQLGQDGVAEWPCQSWWVPAGGSSVLETTYIFDDVKVYALYAQVDTDGHVAESNENNNVFGPVHVQVLASHQVVHESHEDFQMGLASSLDISHPEGVIHPGIFVVPDNESPTAPSVYRPDVQVDHPPLPPSHPNNVNQVKPALASDEKGHLYAVWEDGRNGGVYNRDIFFSYSLDQGQTWSSPDVRINDDPGLPATANQVSPDIVYDPSRNRLYAVWQDARNGDYDIYVGYVDLDAAGVPVTMNWTNVGPLNDDVGSANQMNPSIAVGPPREGVGDYWIYVVWQDQRNGNDDIYLTRSKDGGFTWGSNYFVTDDPDMTWQNQIAPSVAVDDLSGIVVVAWEDWRDPLHPEVYTMWSEDGGQSFGIDVPVTPVPPEQRTTYRVAPTVRIGTTIERVEEWDPVYQITYTVVTSISVIHLAWQEGQEDSSDIYYSYAVFDWHQPETCPWPYKFCFNPPQLVSGFVKDFAYVRPPDEPASEAWPIEPSWQGQVTMDFVPPNLFFTCCHTDMCPRNPNMEPTVVYSKGVIIAWSDARSFDEWRYEIYTRRVASPEGDPKTFEVCDGDWAEGVVNDNAKLYDYRDDANLYQTFKPAATRQQNPYIQVDESGIYLVWDDDRFDRPVEVGTVRNRDIFFTQMRSPDWRVFPPSEALPADDVGIYLSPVIDSRASDPRWYVLTWWGATEFYGDLLFQTRFGNTPSPPQTNSAVGTWTKWTGNPSSTYLGCTAGEGCYYDAPGRHIVDPAGKEWFDCPGPDCPDNYRYIQYKVIMRLMVPVDPVLSRTTAVSQVKIYYRGPYTVYLPVVHRNYY
ncbi:MAG: CARDB domain-containing protein [Anaerolineae bacterium]